VLPRRRGASAMTALESLKADLRRHEGLRLAPYSDTVGKITIGYGRNLTDNGITPKEAEAMLDHDARNAWSDCEKYIHAFDDLDSPRKVVVANMMFNLGATRLLKFSNFITALSLGDFVTAAAEMRNSAWYRQVGTRGEELEMRMFKGESWTPKTSRRRLRSATRATRTHQRSR
jgi:lysozyme